MLAEGGFRKLTAGIVANIRCALTSLLCTPLVIEVETAVDAKEEDDHYGESLWMLKVACCSITLMLCSLLQHGCDSSMLYHHALGFKRRRIQRKRTITIEHLVDALVACSTH